MRFDVEESSWDQSLSSFPCLDVGRILLETIDSVERQTMACEIIVVNDGSTDEDTHRALDEIPVLGGYCFWLRILRLDREVVQLPEVLFGYRQREGQLTKSATSAAAGRAGSERPLADLLERFGGSTAADCRTQAPERTTRLPTLPDRPGPACPEATGRHTLEV